MRRASRRRAARSTRATRRVAPLLDVPAGRRPTAIIAQSDLLAVGVLRAAEELGIARARRAQRASASTASGSTASTAHVLDDARAARDREGAGGGGARCARRSPAQTPAAGAAARRELRIGIDDRARPPRLNILNIHKFVKEAYARRS